MNKKILSAALGLMTTFAVATDAAAQDGDYDFAVCSKDKAMQIKGAVRVEGSGTFIDKKQTQAVIDQMFQKSIGQFNASVWETDEISSEFNDLMKASGEQMALAQKALGANINISSSPDPLPGCDLK